MIKLRKKPAAIKGPKGMESLYFLILNKTKNIAIIEPIKVEYNIIFITECNPNESPNKP